MAREPEDGCLYSSYEGVESRMSGVYHLNWYPSGPKVMTNILNWLGFPEVRLLRWTKQLHKVDRPNDKNGRLHMIASRREGLLAKVEEGQTVEKRRRPRRPPQLAPDPG